MSTKTQNESVLIESVKVEPGSVSEQSASEGCVDSGADGLVKEAEPEKEKTVGSVELEVLC